MPERRSPKSREEVSNEAVTSPSFRRNALIVLLHGVTAVLLAPSGLILPFRPYVAVWGVWTVIGAVAWTQRDAPRVVLAVLFADLALLAATLAALPNLLVLTP